MTATMYTWPDWMPRPLLSGYAIQPLDRRQTTETEAGEISRMQFDTDECEVECSLLLSPERAAWFETFERDVLAQGTIWFWMPLWSAGRVTEHLVRFKERPKVTGFIGIHAQYSFTLIAAGRGGAINRATAISLMSQGHAALLAAFNANG